VKRGRPASAPQGSAGAVLVVVLVLTAAGMALASAVAGTAALELAMAEGGISRLRALQAAEAGLSAAREARAWSVAAPWNASGALPGGGAWRAEVRLFAARVDAASGAVEWLFEIESSGRHGPARATLLEGFSVTGGLPGEPRHHWWRQLEPAP